MGKLKQLLPFGGQTIIERVVGTYRSAVDVLYVVLGHDFERIQSVIQQLPVHILHNMNYRDGMITSIQCAIRAMPAEVEGVLLGLVDQPLIARESIHQIIKCYHRCGIVIPSYEGRRGHPIVIHREYFPEILELTDVKGGLRTLMQRHISEISYVDIDDPAILRDLDTPEDYEGALRELNTRR